MKEGEILKGIWEKDREYAFIYAIEEMAELTKELCKSLEGRGWPDKIAEEVADVLVTVSVIQHIDKETVDKKKLDCILKLGKRLNFVDLEALKKREE